MLGGREAHRALLDHTPPLEWPAYTAFETFETDLRCVAAAGASFGAEALERLAPLAETYAELNNHERAEKSYDAVLFSNAIAYVASKTSGAVRAHALSMIDGIDTDSWDVSTRLGMAAVYGRAGAFDKAEAVLLKTIRDATFRTISAAVEVLSVMRCERLELSTPTIDAVKEKMESCYASAVSYFDGHLPSSSCGIYVGDGLRRLREELAQWKSPTLSPHQLPR